MPRYFDLNLDLTKIDKDKIFEGKKGKYYRVSVVLNDEVGQYDQIGYVKTATTKDERDAGYEASYLGNLKEKVFNKNQQQQAPPAQAASAADDDMPF